MKIKKISQVFAVVGKVLSAKNNSTKDTYSCDYLNKKVEVVNVAEAGTDANDYVTNGTYFFTYANSPTNAPYSSVAGWLEVIARNNENDVKQIWHVYHANNIKYERIKLNGTWSEWEKFIREDDIYYKDGDKYETTGTSYLYLGSMLSSGGTRIYATVFTNKSLKKIKSITVNNYNLSARKVSGGYLVNGVTPETFEGTCSAQVVAENAISIFWTANTAYDEVNNSPAGITLGELSLTFNE